LEAEGVGAAATGGGGGGGGGTPPVAGVAEELSVATGPYTTKIEALKTLLSF